MNKNWYNIQGKATDSVVDIYLFDEIGAYGITAQDFINEIKEYKDTSINLRINCIGGDVFDGMAIYNIIKKRNSKTTAYIEGIAASMGSVIALAADEVVMAENSLFMIHNAWGGAMGEAEDMRKTASVLEKISGEIANIYQKKTRLLYDRITSMMDEETWLNAKEAYDLGFIDTISDSIKVAAKYDVSKFKNITTEQIQNKLNINVNNKKMTEELKNWFNNKVEEIVATVKGADNKSEVVESEVNVILSDNEEISNKLSSFEASVTDLNGKIVSLEEDLVSNKGQNETLSSEIERLNALLSKADAKGTEINTDGDPAVVENKTVDANATFYNAMAERVRAKFNN
jgi:ATP-dependent Clp endopeptidase proteolytic subunit ClpP|tara:strand:+ start:1157 stop:2188 length:1032 start_codon:yes stop_codon:yes gene_type:complete